MIYLQIQSHYVINVRILERYNSLPSRHQGGNIWGKITMGLTDHWKDVDRLSLEFFTKGGFMILC